MNSGIKKDLNLQIHLHKTRNESQVMNLENGYDRSIDPEDSLKMSNLRGNLNHNDSNDSILSVSNPELKVC